MPKPNIIDSKPMLVSTNPHHMRRKAAEKILPKGASLTQYASLNTSSPFGNGGQHFFHSQIPYNPEVDSPDRLYFPQDRKDANKYWRLFYKMDPMFGTAIDMMAEMITGDFDIFIASVSFSLSV
jgi:hypothetical protein